MNEGNSNVNESTHPCPSQAWEGMNEGHSNANESTHPYPLPLPGLGGDEARAFATLVEQPTPTPQTWEGMMSANLMPERGFDLSSPYFRQSSTNFLTSLRSLRREPSSMYIMWPAG